MRSAITELAGLPVLTAAAMRAAEDRAIAAGTDVATLMERAGAGIARWTARLGSGAPVLVLCGPGNNGGDGYVTARILRAQGVDVMIAALGPPKTDAARNAAAAWAGQVDAITDAASAPVVIDALLGTGASRPLDSRHAVELIGAARLAIAADLPSGLDTDSGAPIGEVARCHVTLALGALKPAHLLQPGTDLCGAIRVIDIGIAAESAMRVLDRPTLSAPGPDAHKYTRGMVAVVAGAMPGAAVLAAEAALRAGAGYAALVGDGGTGGPQALVRRPWEAALLSDRRIGCIVIGPGLGRDASARERLVAAIASERPLVIDGDALRLLDPARMPAGSILSPHAGEFAALFGESAGSKLDRTRAAAQTCGAVVVHKGADTVIAAPDGRVALAPPASPWLSTAGTGDVLAGAIAAQRAAGLDPFAAAQAGVWLHARAAGRLGAAFVADDLAHALSVVRP